MDMQKMMISHLLLCESWYNLNDDLVYEKKRLHT